MSTGFWQSGNSLRADFSTALQSFMCEATLKPHFSKRATVKMGTRVITLRSLSRSNKQYVKRLDHHFISCWGLRLSELTVQVYSVREQHSLNVRALHETLTRTLTQVSLVLQLLFLCNGALAIIMVIRVICCAVHHLSPDIFCLSPGLSPVWHFLRPCEFKKTPVWAKAGAASP